MKKIINASVAIVVAANMLMLAGIVVWAALSRADTFPAAAPILFIFFCTSLFFPRLYRRMRPAPANRCELCQKKRGHPTDDMQWADHYGLIACHSCSFKLHVAFGDPDTQHRPRLMH